MLQMVEHRTLDSPVPLRAFPSPSPFTPEVKMPEVKVQEDAVDIALAAADGRIHRKKDPQM